MVFLTFQWMEPGIHGQIGVPVMKRVEEAGLLGPENVTHLFITETHALDPQMIGKNVIPTIVQVSSNSSAYILIKHGKYSRELFNFSLTFISYCMHSYLDEHELIDMKMLLVVAFISTSSLS